MSLEDWIHKIIIDINRYNKNQTRSLRNATKGIHNMYDDKRHLFWIFKALHELVEISPKLILVDSIKFLLHYT